MKDFWSLIAFVAVTGLALIGLNTTFDARSNRAERLLIKSLTEGVEIQLYDRTAVLKQADGTLVELPPLISDNEGRSEEFSVPSAVELGGPEKYLVTRKAKETEVIISLGQPLQQAIKVVVHYVQHDDKWEFKSHSISAIKAPEQFLHYVYTEAGIPAPSAIIDLRKRAQSVAYMKAIEAQKSSQK